MNRPSRARLLVVGLATSGLAVGVLAPFATPADAAGLGVPGLVGPNSSAAVLKDVTLTWQPVPGATGYRVEVGTDSQWSDTPTYAATSAGTRLTLPVWLPHAS